MENPDFKSPEGDGVQQPNEYSKLREGEPSTYEPDIAKAETEAHDSNEPNEDRAKPKMDLSRLGDPGALISETEDELDFQAGKSGTDDEPK